ncbi:MAG: gamma-glutamyltransferase [Rhizomicrobium sp.]
MDPRRLIAVSAVSLVSACSIFGTTDQVVPGRGYVVADEPQAAQVGADILAHGGNAADAITATYLALSVTYPVAAGLGGGGVCVVRAGQKSASFDFQAREAGGPYAVPGNVSGFSMLQAIYGRLPWQRVVAPAESFAAAGFGISHGLEVRLADSSSIVRLDATLSSEFLNESGEIRPVGSQVTAPALAQTLARIRTQGPEVFYRGRPANQIVSYSGAQGGGITAADLESYAADRSAPLIVRVAGLDVYLPAASTGAGRYASAILSHLVGAQGRVEVSGSKLAPLVFSAAKGGLLANDTASPPPDLGSTGFAAVDGQGMAVACGVTMNGPFGSGHTVAPTGVTLANAPNIGRLGLSNTFLTPLVAMSDGQLLLAGTGTGGPEGSAGILLTMLQAAGGENIIEPGILRGTGHEPLETVNIIGCRSDICVAVADPRSYGLGAAAN